MMDLDAKGVQDLNDQVKAPLNESQKFDYFSEDRDNRRTLDTEETRNSGYQPPMLNQEA